MTQANNSGIVPIDKRVLVMPDPVSEKIGSIFIPETHKEKEEYAQTLATVIAVGETAFGEAIVEAKRYGLAFSAPMPGDRVIIGKYAGMRLKGPKDGGDYRMINDDDICARLED
jgi:chaperonin GroES